MIAAEISMSVFYGDTIILWRTIKLFPLRTIIRRKGNSMLDFSVVFR